MDPRLYQISALAGLMIYGMGWLDFEISPLQAAVTLAATLLAQWLCTIAICRFRNAVNNPDFDGKFEPKSALISGLSLCLLLRTNSLWLVVAACVLTISSKFLLRWRGKHLFNPTNFGIVAMLAVSDSLVWVSPGQWGNIAFFAFLMACLGGLVVNRAFRSDVTLAFLVFYLALVFGWSLYLGEPMTIPLHRLQNGGLLLFSFFMVSDPKTTPDSRMGRILFAALVAYGAWHIQFRMFTTNGLLWSLAICSLLVPIIDWLLPGKRYYWRDRTHRDTPVPAPQTALP